VRYSAAKLSGNQCVVPPCNETAPDRSSRLSQGEKNVQDAFGNKPLERQCENQLFTERSLPDVFYETSFIHDSQQSMLLKAQNRNLQIWMPKTQATSRESTAYSNGPESHPPVHFTRICPQTWLRVLIGSWYDCQADGIPESESISPTCIICSASVCSSPEPVEYCCFQYKNYGDLLLLQLLPFFFLSILPLLRRNSLLAVEDIVESDCKCLIMKNQSRTILPAHECERLTRFHIRDRWSRGCLLILTGSSAQNETS
jgi:hypothetical protein